MLSPPERRVLDAARRRARSSSGASGPQVAAAAMDTAGTIYSGVSDGPLTGGLCAERAVLGRAVAEKAGPLMTMVAVDGGGGVVTPCGRCRQTLLDRQPGCHVIVPTPDGPDSVNVRHLVPHLDPDPRADPDRFIRFSAQYFDLVREGRKTATTRLDDLCRSGPAELVFEFDDCYRTLPGVVESTTTKQFAELTDEDARRQGGSVADDLKRLLRHHYPAIGNDDAVDVVTFRVEHPAH